MIASLNISLVLHGTHKEDNGWGAGSQPPRGGEEEDPFAVPKEMGIFQEISRCVFPVGAAGGPPWHVPVHAPRTYYIRLFLLCTALRENKQRLRPVSAGDHRADPAEPGPVPLQGPSAPATVVDNTPSRFISTGSVLQTRADDRFHHTNKSTTLYAVHQEEEGGGRVLRPALRRLLALPATKGGRRRTAAAERRRGAIVGQGRGRVVSGCGLVWMCVRSSPVGGREEPVAFGPRA